MFPKGKSNHEKDHFVWAKLSQLFFNIMNMIKQTNFADYHIPQIEADFMTLRFIQQTLCWSLICKSLHLNKKDVDIFALLETHRTGQRENLLKSCITIDIKPHPHPRTVWRMENYWAVPL